MGNNKPQIFIASSTEGLDAAYAIQESLDNDAECTVWTQGIFDPSSYTIPSLMNQLNISNYGIFAFTMDDEIIIRDQKQQTIRDNVVLELGMFMGALGPDNCFIIMPESDQPVHLPTDLTGMTLLYYKNDRKDKNIQASLGPSINKIRRKITSNRCSNEQKATISDDIAKQISSIGLNAFYSSRDDYTKYREDAPSIDKYINRARKSIVMVSITLTTGLSFDDICKVIEEKLKGITDFEVTISLLNPFNDNLYDTISPLFDQNAETLQKNTKETIINLKKLRDKLGDKEQKRFVIRAHNTLPFGSAIILDAESECGTIQLETKPYKVGMRKSFAFEIRNNKSTFYNTILSSYLSLIEDGLSQDELFSQL